MDYQMKQSGGLTDAQFEANPQAVFRNRNWFGTPWNVFSIQLDTKINDNLTSNTKLFGLVGERNSWVYSTPNVADAINLRQITMLTDA
jgi:Fe(3+) dicitrate transport protein